MPRESRLRAVIMPGERPFEGLVKPFWTPRLRVTRPTRS